MRNLLVAIAVSAALVASMSPNDCGAQYYGYPYYYYPNTPPQVYQPNQAPSNPFLYRLAPNPRVYRKWDQQIRIWDFQEFQRSPLNPESPLDYLLRTY